MVTISKEKPPVFERASQVFDFTGMTPIFAYDHVIYNPMLGFIDDFMVVHEEVHFAQQDAIGVDVWWEKYFTDPKFRFDQEVPAYQAQYKAFCREIQKEKDRQQYLRFLADNLSSAMYGSMVTMFEAKDIIRG